eukprot:170706-Pyramimonas_sp.AAC.1
MAFCSIRGPQSPDPFPPRESFRAPQPFVHGPGARPRRGPRWRGENAGIETIVSSEIQGGRAEQGPTVLAFR